MEPDAPTNLAGEPAAELPHFNAPRPRNSDKPTSRRSNHIVRHNRDTEPIIPVPRRVAQPVTVNPTPEQARQAAAIASTAFQPSVPAPTFASELPPEGQASVVAAAAPVAEPKGHKALLAVLIILGVIVVAAIAGVAGYYLAKN